jgi:hypothetical protein
MAGRKPALPEVMAPAAQKLSPLEIVQDKLTLVSDCIDYLAIRPGGAGYTTDEDAQIKAQFLRFSARLSDLNDQFAAVIADETSVTPPTAAQIQVMLDASDNLARLNRDEDIANASLNFLDAALDAAKPLAKA